MIITPIGVIHTPHKQATGTPLQPVFAQGTQGTVELFPQFAPGLKDLDGFERIWLLYWFDRASEAQLEVTPFLDTHTRGLFATRSPCRPNPLGISCVRINRIEGNVIHVLDLDMLDGTPLVDIKPYVPAFDAHAAERIGWFGTVKSIDVTADDRFETKSVKTSLP